MNRSLRIAVRKWLDHELAGRDRRAESALARVFSRLPAELPAAGFAERILARAGLAAPPEARDLRGLRVRLLLASCGVLAAAALTFVPSLVETLWVGLGSGKMVELGVQGLMGLSQRLAQGVRAWDALAGAGEMVGSALATPRMLTMMAFSALLSLGALRMLQGLLVSDRSRRHV